MKKKNIIIVALIFVVFYILYKVGSKNKKMFSNFNPPTITDDNVVSEINNELNTKKNIIQRNVNVINGKCTNPSFLNKDISGRMCAGSVINENKILKLGDQGCGVLLLQQRLNGIQSDKYILKPNGQFNCATRNKLLNVIGMSEIRLNDFQPDEQTGFNELQEGKFVKPYSYMDIDNLKNK